MVLNYFLDKFKARKNLLYGFDFESFDLLGLISSTFAPKKQNEMLYLANCIWQTAHKSGVQMRHSVHNSGWKLFIKLKTVGVLPNKVHQWLSSQTLVKLNPGCCEYAHWNGPSPKGSQVGYVKTTRNTCLFGMWPFTSILFPVSYYKQTFSFCKTANSCELSLSWN